MSQSMLDRFNIFLVNQGLRMTGQRELIARTFFQSTGHISTEELHLQVKKVAPGIGFATVYRTIKLLSEAGLAQGRSFGDTFARYESASQNGHHDHLVCTRCGKIIEFENDRIEELQKAVAVKHGYHITDHKLELYGICRNCQN